MSILLDAVSFMALLQGLSLYGLVGWLIHAPASGLYCPSLNRRLVRSGLQRQIII